MHSVTSNAVANKLGTDKAWTTVVDGVKYRIRNGICTVAIDLSSATFNSNGVCSIATLPSEARPSTQLKTPVSIYGLSGSFNYNETQTWLTINIDGGTQFIGGIVSKTSKECHVCISYCL